MLVFTSELLKFSPCMKCKHWRRKHQTESKTSFSFCHKKANKKEEISVSKCKHRCEHIHDFISSRKSFCFSAKESSPPKKDWFWGRLWLLKTVVFGTNGSHSLYHCPSWQLSSHTAHWLWFSQRDMWRKSFQGGKCQHDQEKVFFAVFFSSIFTFWRKTRTRNIINVVVIKQSNKMKKNGNLNVSSNPLNEWKSLRFFTPFTQALEYHTKEMKNFTAFSVRKKAFCLA
jgi:hypothetical protein